jgi:predicted TIM-barrel fold metal-dependent hydrolase
MAAAMDAAGVDVQALSLTAPGVEQLEVEEAKTFARESNAALAEAVRRHPTRFFGLAALPIGDPPAEVAELERVVGEHGFKGIVINGHHRGRYLDDRFFWPVLAQGEALKLYLHPTPSPKAVIDAWYGGLSPSLRLSNCCCRSASNASCSRPIIPINRWPRAARSSTGFPSATPTGRE